MELREKLKDVIRRGFDLGTISDELAIPLTDLQALQEEIIEEQKLEQQKLEERKLKDQLSLMRKKYRELCEDGEIESKKTQIEMPEEQNEKVENLILDFETRLSSLSRESTKQQRQELAQYIIKETVKIKIDTLTTDQIIRMYKLLDSKVLENLDTVSDRYNSEIKRLKDKISLILAKGIDRQAMCTDNLETLKQLFSQITPKMASQIPVGVGSVKSKIGRKISDIQQREAISKVRTEVPPCIQDIIQSLAEGTTNIEASNKAIREVARLKLENLPKTKFAMTEEQQIRQIIIQMKTILSEQPKQYTIANPEQTVLQLNELTGEKIELSIQTVIENLLGSKRFDEARGLCNKFAKQNYKQKDINNFLNTQKKKIRNAELSDLISRLLNSRDMTEEQEIQSLRLINMGLKRKEVYPNQIILKIRESDKKKVTFEDVLEENPTKSRSEK